MKILQQTIKAKRGSRVLVSFSQPTNVFLMTEVNFKRYKDGASHKRLGGKYDRSPAEFVAPYDGTWHAVIEKGSHFSPLNITGSVEVLPPKRKDVPYFMDDTPSPSPAAKVEEEVTDSNEDQEEDNSSEENEDQYKGEDNEEEDEEKD